MITFLKRFFDKSSIQYKVRIIRREVKIVAQLYSFEKIKIYKLGVYDIDPKCLFLCICVQTDSEKKRLLQTEILFKELKSILLRCNYPQEAIEFVEFEIESQETVDRESDGHWFYHFK